MATIQHKGFTVDSETKLITFDKGVEPVIGSLCDGDTMYLRQGRICLDAMICFFDIPNNRTKKNHEEHCMWQIEVFEHKDKEYGPDFCNYTHYANVPHTDELEKIDTICIYTEDGKEAFKQCFEAYTKQMHKLITQYSTLTGI